MRVLISGGGIAGPALAWWLSRAGMNVVVLEKAEENLKKGQNVDIRGSAIQLLKRMGLLDEVRRCTSGESGTQFIAPDGRPFAFFPAEDGGMTAEFEILRGDLSTIFFNATKDDDLTTYRFGVTIASVISNDDKSVKVQLSNGDIQEYDCLVAADGHWSKTRQSVFQQDQVEVDDKNVYVVYFTIPKIESDNDRWNIYHATMSRILCTRPDPHGTTRGLLGTTPLNAEQKKAWDDAARSDRQTKEEVVLKHFTGCGWQTDRLLSEMVKSDDFYFQGCKQIKMQSWSSGRVVCLGDAAWAPTPLTGTGTSLAILGAYVLAGSLSQLSEGKHPASAFSAFETAFRPFVSRCQHFPPLATYVAYPTSNFTRWLLQSTIWTAHGLFAAISRIGSLSLVKKAWSLLPAKSDGDKAKGIDYKLPHYPAFAKILQ